MQLADASSHESAQEEPDILVAKGFSQREGIEYFENFPPTPAPASIRLVEVVAVGNGMGSHRFGAKQALVQSEVDAYIFMRMPHGYGDLSGIAILLNQSMQSEYGLEQKQPLPGMIF